MSLKRGGIATLKLLTGMSAGVVLAALSSTDGRADTLPLGAAGDYAILFEGGGSNTLQITNVTVNGNVGVGGIRARPLIQAPPQSSEESIFPLRTSVNSQITMQPISSLEE